MDHSPSSKDWIRRASAIGAITAVIVSAIYSLAYSTAEASLIAKISPNMSAVLAARTEAPPVLADGRPMPDLTGGVAWLNSAPLSTRSLRGRVVLINFWTYTCINSLRALPYVKAWAAKYQNAGLVVIGAHTPEFSFEKEQTNVEAASRDLHVSYPVVMDSNYRIWQDFNNQYWPAFYIADAKGRIRYQHFGEGDYGETERLIQELLKENGATNFDPILVNDTAQNIEAPASNDERSPETYIGFGQAERFSSPGKLDHDKTRSYSEPTELRLNHWGLSGSWDVNGESAVLQATPGKIVFRFHSRDLHLVMAPSKDGKPIRFKVLLDGAAPGTDCGVDSSPNGTGVAREPRLYQLVRQKGPIKDRTFEIQFLDSGVQALDFTFG